MSSQGLRDTSGTIWDWPNQQVVREDHSGPGIDDAAAADTEPEAKESNEDLTLDEMTKDQLLERAQSLGISPANAAMSKAELRDALDDYYEDAEE